jgi:hypothetical protein
LVVVLGVIIGFEIVVEDETGFLSNFRAERLFN